ncbi:MAG: cardiolipin synthase [Gammaproteobacteria bacterium]|jgi:cardiolipin synthase
MPTEHVITIVGASFAALEILAIAVAIHALMNTRTSQGAIAWAISLIAFPLASLPLYAVFGRGKFRGYVDARRAGELNVQHIAALLARQYAQPMRAGFSAQESAYATFERLAKMPFTRCNAVRLLVDGDATFAAVFAGIRSATRYVLVQFFIIREDEIGSELRTLLARKASEGVQVLLLFDEIGCHKLPRRYLDALSEAGVAARAFRTTQGRANRFQINFRNHRKVVVVDGHTAYVGGHNVGDEYLGRHPRLSPWRDTHLEIRGPAALATQLAFVEDWYWATRQVPGLSWSPETICTPGQRVLILPTGPADTLDTCALFFVQAINAAQERIWITSPYFVPDETVVAALQLAALRGVDVRIMLPAHPDHRLVYLAGLSYVEDSVKNGIHLYRYQRGFLHQKTLLVDDDLAAVGTANLDNRSFRLNFEFTAIVADRGFAAQVAEMLTADFHNCRAVEADELESRPLPIRVAARAARLLAPVL